MLGWAAILAGGLVAGAAIGILVRRERVLFDWLKEELAGLRENVDLARVEVRSLGPLASQDLLDCVEGDDVEIGGNLDRMNLLLDRLNGLLRGGTASHHGGPGPVFHEEDLPLAAGLDFTSSEELMKFGNLPPLSEEEIESIDWEYLFNRIRTDHQE